MTHDPVLARLAAANPVPLDVPVTAHRPRIRPRAAFALAAAVAVAIPAAAFADQIGSLLGLGLGNEGTTVATSSVPEANMAELGQAMRDLQWPGSSQLLASSNGFSFYASRNADGAFCLTIDVDGGQPGSLVGCAPVGGFPDSGAPIFGEPMNENGNQLGNLAGVATDQVARVALLDSSGNELGSAPVVDNVYAVSGVPETDATTIVAYDASGNVLYRRDLSQAP